MMARRPSILTGTAALCGLGLILAGCGAGGDLPVRTGPQSVHPSPSALAQGSGAKRAAPVAAAPQAQAATSDPAEALFQEFCLNNRTGAAQTEAALRASGRFAAPRVTEFGGGASRYVSYDLTNGMRGGVVVTYGTGIQCSVGIDNRGVTLYEDGRITRP